MRKTEKRASADFLYVTLVSFRVRPPAAVCVCVCLFVDVFGVDGSDAFALPAQRDISVQGRRFDLARRGEPLDARLITPWMTRG